MDRRRFLLSLTIVAAAVCLVLGLVLPIVRLTRLYVWTNEHSMVSIVWALFREEEYFLCAIIFAFSVLLPIVKLVYLLAAASLTPSEHGARYRMLSRLEWLGKWSMLDVLVLALTIFYVKSTGIAEAEAQLGIYFFTAAVLLTMVAHGWVKQP